MVAGQALVRINYHAVRYKVTAKAIPPSLYPFLLRYYGATGGTDKFVILRAET